MYDVSDNYLSNVLESGTIHSLKIYINDLEIDEKYYLGCSIESNLFSSDEFCFGSKTARTCEIKLHKDALTDDVEKIYIETGIRDDDEVVPLGYFNLEDISYDDDYTVTITGIDYMALFEFNYDGSELTYPATLLTILQDICDTAGVELGSTSFLNSDSEVSVYDNTVTARTYIGYIAELAGGFATIGRDGKLYIKTIGEYTYELSIDKFQNFSWGEEFIISRIAYEDGVQDFKTGDTTNNTVWISSDNMYVVNQEQIDNIYNNCNIFTCYSFSGSTIIDPAIDVGDLLLIDDKLVIYQGTIEYKGKFKAEIDSEIQCKEKEDTTATTVSTTTKLRRVQSSIDQEEAKIELLAEEISETSETVATLRIEIGSITQSVSAGTFTNTDLTETGEIHLTDTIAGVDYLYTLQITGTMTAGTVTLVISDISRNSEDEATTTEMEIILPEDTEEITYKNGVFYSGDTELEVSIISDEETTEDTTISLLDVDTYIYIKEYENLTYYANYDKYYSILAQLALKVDTDTLLSTISAQADNIYFESGILTFTSGNFLLDETGHVTISNGLFIYQADNANGAGLELFGNPPYIDFHYGNSEEDYTTRLIEIESGKLSMYGDWINLPISNTYGTGYAMHGADDKEYTYQVKYESDTLKFYVDGEQIGSLCGDNTGDQTSTGSSGGSSSFPSTGTTSRTIFGIRRELASSSTVWERTDDAQGLVANATKDGSEVENDFDNWYPWSDIVTCNYDTEEMTITAYLGDTDFTFSPDDDHTEVMVLVPEFWWRRYQDDTYEYIQIATYEADGFTHMPAFMVGRYPTSLGDGTRVHSRSGTTPLGGVTADTFRSYSRSLGENWNEMDIWHLAAIQMLYLVEYADYNCQSEVGNGVTSSTKTDSGGCDSLGNLSGCLGDDETYSVSYRGMEDLWGNVYYCIDGLNIISYVPYVCEDDDSYTYDSSDSPYMAVSATMPSSSGYIKSLSYDSSYPSVMIPTATGGSSSKYVPDYYYYGSSNRVLWAGGYYSNSTYCGLWFASLNASTYTGTSNGGRLLYTSD